MNNEGTFTPTDVSGSCAFGPYGYGSAKRNLKRQFRLLWQFEHALPKRQSKGWRRRVRRMKAKL